MGNTGKSSSVSWFSLTLKRLLRSASLLHSNSSMIKVSIYSQIPVQIQIFAYQEKVSLTVKLTLMLILQFKYTMKNFQNILTTNSSSPPTKTAAALKSPSKATWLLILVGLICQLESSSATNHMENENRVSTTFDGVTSDRYLSYLKLDGSNGGLVQLQDASQLHTDLEYTFMMWFKPMSSNWGQRLSYAFKIDGSFQCYFTGSNQLICESEERCEKLHVETSQIQTNQWAHLTISGHPSSGSFLALESNTKTLNEDQKSYVILRQGSHGWKSCIGSCDGKYGFIGGIREFIFFQQNVSQETAKRIKNHYFLWDKSFKAYYRFSADKFLQDEFRHHKVQINWSPSQQIHDIQGKDYISNDICFPIQNFEPVMHFDGNNEIQTLDYGRSWSPLQINYGYTMSVWLKISPQSCIQSNPMIAKNDCNILELEDSFLLYLSSGNEARFHFFALKNYYETQSNGIFVPYDQWVNIQMTMSQFDGYEIRTFDILGRQIDRQRAQRNLQEQRPTSKLSLFKNFKGQARSIVLYEYTRALPLLVTDDVERIDHSKCILFLKFQPKHVTSNSIINLSQQMDVGLNGNPNFKYVMWEDFKFEGNSTKGLVSHSETLFDGIACNDGHYSLQLKDQSSYVKTTTPPLIRWLQETTVEFWFKIQDSEGQLRYLFSMWAQRQQREFFTISTSATRPLSCAPFNVTLSRNPRVEYKAFTDEFSDQHGWLHLSCSYEYSKEIVGHLHSTGSDHTYTTSIQNSAQYVAEDKFEIYMGNSRTLNRGTGNFLAKELRVWSVKRSEAEIKQWRHTQFNPKTLADKSLLSYLRMTTGSFNEFNFASVGNSSITSEVSFDQISYVPDDGLVICPIETFYSDHRCFLDPVEQLLAAALPYYNSTSNELSWIFSANLTSLIEKTSLSQLSINWQTTDPVIRSISEPMMNRQEMRIPASAFKEESDYPITLNVSNPSMTFVKVQNIKFVPNSCHWYEVENGDAFSFFRNYTNPPAIDDISFNLVLREQNNGCSDFIFYDKLVESIKYTFSPMPSKPARLRFDFSNNRLVGVTLPKEEQSKFPSKENIQIVLSIFWTNQIHSSVLSTEGSTFQHVVYTLHFNERGATVFPRININQSRILKGQTVVLNATESHLVPSSGYTKSDLMFKWVCPTSLDSLCSEATNLTLRIPYEGFVDASGSFDQEYEFQIEVSLNKSDGETERYYQSEYITWYDAAPTNFTLNAPKPVASTAEDQEFKVTLDNYDDTELDQLNILWAIVPNLTNSNLGSASDNGTVFTVSKNGFALQTQYSMFVTAVNRDQEFVTYSQSISFSTSKPPSGGSAKIAVDSKDGAEVENFTISLTDWTSDNQPIKYRIWSTSDSSGEDRQSEMTFGWVQASEKFSFIPPNDNPYQVEITDESKEKVVLTLQAPNEDQPETSSLIQQLSSVNGQIPMKYSLMNQIVNSLQTNKNQDATGDQQQEEETSVILGKIEEDMKIINDDHSIEAGDSKVIVGETVKMLSIITQDTSRISEEIVQRTLKIMANLTEPVAVFRQLLTNTPDFKNQYAKSLSNTLDYTDMKVQNIHKGRNLESSTASLTGIKEINEQVQKAKDVFMSLLCASTQIGDPQQEIKTSSFNLMLEKFSKSSSASMKEFVFSGDRKTRINLNATELIEQLSESQQLDDQTVCLHVAFYKVNLKPVEQDGENEKSQYSSPVLEYSLVDETGELDLVQSLDFKAFSQVFFSIEAETFKNNQTICMAYQLSEQMWAGQACKTTIEEKNMQVECYCNMMGNDQIGLFTDTSRLLNSQIEDPSVANEDISEVLTPYHSTACVGVILIIVLFAIVTPITAFILDRKDFKNAQNKITIRAKEQLLQQVAQISEEPFALWRHRQEQVYSYAFQNRNLFSHYLTSLHPLFNVFSRYDILEMRLVRYALFFAQFSLFTFICVVTFGPQYRDSAYERNEIGLDIRDANAIIILGFFGTIMLLPFPYLSKLFRSKYELNQHALKANKTDERMRQVSQSGREIFLGENTQEQNMIGNNNPIQFFNCNSSQQQNPNEELFVRPQNRVASIVIFGFAGILCVISFVLSIAFSTKTPVFNQYCMVASFYTGVFGSLFISNIVKIGIDSLLATRVADNNRSFLRFVVSSGAVDIVNEIRLVKQAEQLIYKMESADDITPKENLHKRYEDQPEVSNVEEALDKSNQNSEENVSVADVDLAISCKNPFRTQNVSPNIRNQIELDQDGLRSDMNRKSYESALGRVKSQLDTSNKSRVRYSSVSKNGTQSRQIDGTSYD